MSPDTNQTKEALSKKPSITESVEDLILKKKAEKESEASNRVSEQATGIQSEVAEVMAGVEKPKEKISERKGESGEQGDIKSGSGSTATDQKIGPVARTVIMPSEEVMIKKIRSVIKAQIKIEIKKANKLRKNLTRGGAQEYNSSIARIRKLKILLASLFTATFQFVKNLYFKCFTPDGKKRPMEDAKI